MGCCVGWLGSRAGSVSWGKEWKKIRPGGREGGFQFVDLALPQVSCYSLCWHRPSLWEEYGTPRGGCRHVSNCWPGSSLANRVPGPEVFHIPWWWWQEGVFASVGAPPFGPDHLGWGQAAPPTSSSHARCHQPGAAVPHPCRVPSDRSAGSVPGSTWPLCVKPVPTMAAPWSPVSSWKMINGPAAPMCCI